jgi:23S rRNA pseudouridine2457 synthase
MSDTGSVLIAFNKPFGVLCQFTAEVQGQRTLAAFGFPKEVYPLGRLDADTEGLLLLSDEAALNQRLLRPEQGHWRQYWAQVERVPSRQTLAGLTTGVRIGKYRTLPCRVWLLDPQPELPPREPPIRIRKTVATCWIALELREGKNRQVRRMTAAIGHPTLRLIRVRIGEFELGRLAAGQWKELSTSERQLVLA